MNPLLTESARARFSLIAVTILWGSTFVVIHSGLSLLSPFVLIGLRFLLASAALALLRPEGLKGMWRSLWVSLPLSLSMFAGFALQTMGLQWTTPARSAFITALAVVAVPGFEFLYSRRMPRRRILAGVLLAAAGITVLFQPIDLEWGRGDTLTLLSAAAFAFYVVELARASRVFDTIALVLAQCVTIAVLSALVMPVLEAPRIELGWSAVAVVAYLGLVCTALTFVLMVWGQARIGAIEASIVYTLEPVFAAAFSIALGREALTVKVALGGCLIVAAMMLSGSAASWGMEREQD